MLAEGGAEVVGVVVADLEGDLGDGLVGAGEQLLGFLYADRREVGAVGHVQGFAEYLLKLLGADPGAFGDVGHFQIFLQVLMDVGLGAFQVIDRG